MPFQRPSLSELIDRARQDINAKLPGADSRLRHSNLRVVGDTMAGLNHLTYGRLQWLATQVIPDTAESQYLERWANIFSIYRKTASRAGGRFRFIGANGTNIPAGTLLQTGDRIEYQTKNLAIIANGEALVEGEARDPGAQGNNLANVKLSMITAIPGIQSEVTLAEDFVGGADEESDDDLRDRLLFFLRQRPHGGAAHDYVIWATEVPGVTRAWVYPLELGPGTVTVRFMMDEVRATDGGIPQGTGSPDYSDDLKLVFDHVNFLRPVTAEFYVAAPIPMPVDVTIQYLRPNTAEVQAQAIAELKDMFLRLTEPAGILYRSWIWNAVSEAAGEDSHQIVAPAADVMPGIGHIPVLGTVTFL